MKQLLCADLAGTLSQVQVRQIIGMNTRTGEFFLHKYTILKMENRSDTHSDPDQSVYRGWRDADNGGNAPTGEDVKMSYHLKNNYLHKIKIANSQ